ncbi:hypothetical protein Mapa_013745 [Marchantia paleacea]|nr:hypothetical protein Mapa_013745 [Marchantia paleacea]
MCRELSAGSAGMILQNSSGDSIHNNHHKTRQSDLFSITSTAFRLQARLYGRT